VASPNQDHGGEMAQSQLTKIPIAHPRFGNFRVGMKLATSPKVTRKACHSPTTAGVDRPLSRHHPPIAVRTAHLYLLVITLVFPLARGPAPTTGLPRPLHVAVPNGPTICPLTT
jgi:hypothetical protein